MKALDTAAEGDKVVTRDTWGGTNHGSFLGFAPTHQHVTATGIDVFRLTDGKIVEQWASPDLLGATRRLGLVSLPHHWPRGGEAVSDLPNPTTVNHAARCVNSGGECLKNAETEFPSTDVLVGRQPSFGGAVRSRKALARAIRPRLLLSYFWITWACPPHRATVEHAGQHRREVALE